MSIYVYAPVLYPGTKELLDVLDAKRLVFHDGMQFRHKGVALQFNQEDAIVCWGHHVPPVANTLTINGSLLYKDQLTINKALARMPIPNAMPVLWHELIPLTYDKAIAFVEENPGNLKGLLRITGNMVPVKEHRNWSTRWYNFERQSKVMLFANGVYANVQKAEDVDVIGKILQLYKLDFSVICIGTVNGTYVVRRIITAPTLTKEQAEVFGKDLLIYIKGKRGAM